MYNINSIDKSIMYYLIGILHLDPFFFLFVSY